MDYISENCPLCNRAAKYYLVDFGNRKFFRCEYCNDYQIYTGAEELLSATIEQNKLSISDASHNSINENVMFITTISKPNAPDNLAIEFHDRTTLPLS